MKCKSCQIDLSKKPKAYHYPDNIPISDDMKKLVEGLRSDKNGKGSKSRRHSNNRG